MRGDTRFFRWASRKQEARTAGQAATSVNVAFPDRQLTAVEAAVDESADSYPSLEDLTAESDLTAFLREGVPNFLKNAALRKMWSLDPAIRDHVGLSENSWDFNRLDSIPGFGSIERAASVPEFLSDPAEAEIASLDVPASVRAPECTAARTARKEPAEATGMLPPADEDPESEEDGSPDVAPARAAARHGGAQLQK